MPFRIILGPRALALTGPRSIQGPLILGPLASGPIALGPLALGPLALEPLTQEQMPLKLVPILNEASDHHSIFMLLLKAIRKSKAEAKQEFDIAQVVHSLISALPKPHIAREPKPLGFEQAHTYLLAGWPSHDQFVRASILIAAISARRFAFESALMKFEPRGVSFGSSLTLACCFSCSPSCS